MYSFAFLVGRSWVNCVYVFDWFCLPFHYVFVVLVWVLYLVVPFIYVACDCCCMICVFLMFCLVIWIV